MKKDVDSLDAARFRFLQNLPVVEAQAFFWNYESRRQRARAIDEAMAMKAEVFPWPPADLSG